MRKQIARDTKSLLLVLLCVGLAWSGCKIEYDPPPTTPTNPYPTTPPTTLPEATQTGAGTLGCKINGRVWVFWVPPFALTPEQDAFVTESTGSGVTNIRARIWSADTSLDQKLVYQDIGFSFFNPNFESIILNKAGNGVISSDEFIFSLLINKQSKWYFPDTSSFSMNNELVVDFIDTELNIISGRFDMVLYRGNNYTITDRSDSLIVTDGRFDFKYSQQ
jgi:hypothetical protein